MKCFKEIRIIFRSLGISKYKGIADGKKKCSFEKTRKRWVETGNSSKNYRWSLVVKSPKIIYKKWKSDKKSKSLLLQKKVFECLKFGQQSPGGHILHTSHSVHENVKIENYYALINAYREFFSMVELGR